MLKAMPTVVVPLPADFLKVAGGVGSVFARLLKVAAPPRLFVIAASLWQSHVPLLLITAPVPTLKPPMPAQAVVPPVFRTRDPLRVLPNKPLAAMPPSVLVVPAPVIVPPVQVVRPDTVTVSVP